MKIDFNPNKNARNIALGRPAFTEVSKFNFNTANIAQDVRKIYPEDRFVASGFLGDGARLHMLCFTPIDGGIRVISFRKAHPKEVKAYEQVFPNHTAD
jgi:uncharacterized protein